MRARNGLRAANEDLHEPYMKSDLDFGILGSLGSLGPLGGEDQASHYTRALKEGMWRLTGTR